jgi:hypothetical protein
VHHSTIHKEKSNKTQQCIKNFYSIFIEAQHVSGDTTPIIRSLQPHWQPLVFHTRKVVGRVAGGQHPPATREKGDPFLSKIITGDEAWIHHYDPLAKIQSMEWHKQS